MDDGEAVRQQLAVYFHHGPSPEIRASVITMWLSLATIFLQSMGEDSRRRVWIIGDEILNLQKLPDLGEHMAEGRKFGACFVLGIQNMPQLVNVYGREMAKSIFDLLNTRFYGRSPVQR